MARKCTSTKFKWNMNDCDGVLKITEELGGASKPVRDNCKTSKRSFNPNGASGFVFEKLDLEEEVKAGAGITAWRSGKVSTRYQCNTRVVSNPNSRGSTQIANRWQDSSSGTSSSWSFTWASNVSRVAQGFKLVPSSTTAEGLRYTATWRNAGIRTLPTCTHHSSRAA